MDGYRGNFDEVRGLFARALALPPGERTDFLAAATGDEALRAEVQSILEHVEAPEDSTDLFAEPWVDGHLLMNHARAALGDASRALAPDHARPRIPGFTLEAELGRGSAGIVYRAVQDHPRRLVALKVFDHVLSGSQLRARFEREMNVLAMLDHRGIPHVFGAGVTDQGSPWFAMEVVEGLSLMAFADDASLDRRERVGLVRDLCEVVDHAHRNGVIHRDLKPENILVDRSGRPCVLDFGIARVMDVASNVPAELRTEAGQVLGTLPYMSPEQADGMPDAIDARTDVYSLGVMLYELLTGRLPCDTHGKNLPEALAVIREHEPAPVADADDDLQTVLDVALAKERGARYATASDLADDLGRWLAGRPVLARAPGRVHRIRSFAYRHRAFTVGAGAAALLLVIAFAVSLDDWWSAYTSSVRAQRQRNELLGLSDELRLNDLVAEAETLWPLIPSLAQPMEDWTRRAEELLAVASDHRRVLADLEAGESTVSTAGTGHPEPADPAAVRWHRDNLRRLIDGLDALGSPDGLLKDVRRRHATVTSIGQRSLGADDDEAAASWRACVEAVRTSPLYHGLELQPQLGLVPLGPDPASGLWEFAEVGWSGEAPTRDAESGALDFDGGSSLVFVLLPGGSSLFGAQSIDPAAPRYDHLARPHEGPPRSVSLSPFFISKYELTRGQWARLVGRGDRDRDDTQRDLEPMADRTWVQFRRTLHRHGLSLPTEAQWEYAARGGTDAPWPQGDSPAILATTVNVADLSRMTATEQWNLPTPDLDDGVPSAEPVTSRRPNPFGLHGIHGNVFELCEDVFQVTPIAPPRAGDGLLVGPPDRLRAMRGGSFGNPLEVSRVSQRSDLQEDQAGGTIGVRPVRLLAGATHGR